jgi:small subunit ribosomal protein S9
VSLTEGTGEITVNGRESQEYFPVTTQQFKLQQPFKLTETVGKYDVTVTVRWWRYHRPSGRRAPGHCPRLVKIDADHKPKLKAEELMTRDPRAVERKKFGRKKARKRYQFSKR